MVRLPWENRTWETSRHVNSSAWVTQAEDQSQWNELSLMLKLPILRVFSILKKYSSRQTGVAVMICVFLFSDREGIHAFVWDPAC